MRLPARGEHLFDAVRVVAGEPFFLEGVDRDTVDPEAFRRQTLCGLAWLLDGEAGLAAALDRYPDPWADAPFERVEGSGGLEALAASTWIGSGHWKLRPPQPQR